MASPVEEIWRWEGAVVNENRIANQMSERGEEIILHRFSKCLFDVVAMGTPASLFRMSLLPDATTARWGGGRASTVTLELSSLYSVTQRKSQNRSYCRENIVKYRKTMVQEETFDK